MTIGTLNEKPLHAALKAWYAQPGDRVEVPVGGYMIDLVRGDLLIEIQTRGFAAMKRKLADLLDNHPLRIVYPVACEKWIIRIAPDDAIIGRRKSPRRGTVSDVVRELVSFPALLDHPHLSLDVLLIREDELRRRDDRRSWRRRGWVVEERRLIEVVAWQRFDSSRDLLALLPDDLTDPFTTADIAALTGQSRRHAQQLAYCLREAGVIVPVDKRGNTYVYTHVPESKTPPLGEASG